MSNTTKKDERIQQAILARPRKRGRGGTEISKELLEAAFDLFCNRTSYRKISSAMNISMSSLTKYSKELKWDERRKDRWEKIEKKTDEAVASEESIRRSRHLRIAQAMQSKAIEKLKIMRPDEISVTECRAFLTEGVKLERDLFGESSTADIQIAVIFPQELRDL